MASPGTTTQPVHGAPTAAEATPAQQAPAPAPAVAGSIPHSDEDGGAAFWEAAFRSKREMWGMAPAQSALLARDFFLANQVRTVLVPGIGYGRNAVPFLDSGMLVTGVEVSQTAIDLAASHFGASHLGTSLTIHHGSAIELATALPGAPARYDAVFCYGLVHLFDAEERRRLVLDSYALLADGGVMAFAMITKEASSYGKGRMVGVDRYESYPGVSIYFYDRESVQREFAGVGLVEVVEVPEKPFPFFFVTCKKAA